MRISNILARDKRGFVIGRHHMFCQRRELGEGGRLWGPRPRRTPELLPVAAVFLSPVKLEQNGFRICRIPLLVFVCLYVVSCKLAFSIY